MRRDTLQCRRQQGHPVRYSLTIFLCIPCRHAAASYGNVDVLKWLLEHGGRVDLTDADGDTPLHACETAECADLLLAHGAALALENKEGLTPYHIAVTECRDEMVDWLRKRYTDRGMTLPEVVHESDDGEAGGEVEDD